MKKSAFKFSSFQEPTLSPFEKLFNIFKELIIHTSGDFDEAIEWLRELDKEYKLTDENYTIDPVGAIPVHLFAGIWGTLAVGIFGASAGFDQFMVQLASVGIVGVFCVVCTFIIGLAVKSIMGLRVSEEEEDKGLDIAEHGTGAYGDFSMR